MRLRTVGSSSTTRTRSGEMKLTAIPLSGDAWSGGSVRLGAEHGGPDAGAELRLGDEGIRPHRTGGSMVFRAVVNCRQDHTRGRGPRLDAARGLEAAHPRHVDVEDHDVGPRETELRQGVLGRA